MRIWQAISGQIWAMTQEALENMIQIANRENLDPEAVAAKLGRPLDNTYSVEMRGNVAVLPVTGPLFRYANLFTALSGATSYELLARDFHAAVENPDVSAIVLNIDSPGGEANGTGELADMIHQARGGKPIVAYVGGMAASAGYWIASAADRIVVDETALLGSIGVRTVLTDGSGADQKRGLKRYTIVSSQSPNKDLDASSPEDRARVQRVVDDMAAVFVSRVARNRGVTEETVLSDFGQGDVMVGIKAVDAGLADAIGSLEGVLSELSTDTETTVFIQAPAAAGGTSTTSMEASTMSEKTQDTAPAAEPQPERIHTQADLDRAREDGIRQGVFQERQRIEAILGHESAKGREATAMKLAFTTDMAPDQASAILESVPQAETSSTQGKSEFEKHMETLGNPRVGPDSPEDPEDPEASVRAAVDLGKQYGIQ